MSKQQSWTPARIIYAVLMSGLLLGYMAVIATYKDPTTTGTTFYFPGFVWVIRIITAVLAVWLGKLWKDKGFWLLMVYLLLKTVRVAVPNLQNLFIESVSDDLLTGLWVFCACYGLARAFSKEQLKKFLGINAALWTAGMVANSCLGIYAAWKDQWIYTIGEGAIWGLVDGRLWLTYYVTNSGSVLSVSVLVALSCIFILKNKTGKLLYFLSLIPMMIALSLTDSRCAQVTVATGIAVLIGLFVLYKLRDRFREKGKKEWKAWIPAIAVTGVVFVAVVLCSMKTISLFNQVRTRGLLIPHALADTGDGGTLVSNRGYTGTNILTSRPMIWNAAIQIIKANPRYLLYGTSILNPMNEINASQWMVFKAAHCHCMPLMILLESGIPGVLLMGSFLVMIAVKTFRMIREKTYTWDKTAIAVFLSISAGELIECFTWLRSGQTAVLPFYFVALGIISIAANKRKETNHSAETAEIQAAA